MKDIMQALETQQQALLPSACVCVCVCLQETVYIQIQKEGSGIPAWQLQQLLVRVGVEGETDRNLAFFSACAAAFIFFTSSSSTSAYANQISCAPCAFPKYPQKKSTYVSAKMGVHTYSIVYMHMRISNDDPLEVEHRNVCQFFPGVQSSEKLRASADGPAHLASHTESFPLSLLALLSRSLFQVMVNVSVHMYVCIRLCLRMEFLTTWAQQFHLLGFPLSFVLS